jgi:GTP cyclohydrolase I
MAQSQAQCLIATPLTDCYYSLPAILSGGSWEYPIQGVHSVEQHWAKIIEAVGEDLNRPGLADTPKRAAKAFEFLTRGYNQSVDEVVNNALFPSDSSEMILVQDVELYSLCEHHLLPFIGKCHVAYIPTGKVLGLSKVARIVDLYARRLQIQESLTTQVAETIMKVTDAEGVGVIIEAQHMCMMMRGVEKQNSVMKTSAMLGCFRSEQKTREEFLSLLQMKR